MDSLFTAQDFLSFRAGLAQAKAQHRLPSAIATSDEVVDYLTASFAHALLGDRFPGTAEGYSSYVPTALVEAWGGAAFLREVEEEAVLRGFAFTVAPAPQEDMTALRLDLP